MLFSASSFSSTDRREVGLERRHPVAQRRVGRRPRIRTASRPALRAPPIETVATGTPGGHLHDRQQRVQPVEARQRHRHADHRQRRRRGDHAGQVRGAAGAGDDHLACRGRRRPSRSRACAAACGARRRRRPRTARRTRPAPRRRPPSPASRESLPMITPTRGSAHWLASRLRRCRLAVAADRAASRVCRPAVGPLRVRQPARGQRRPVARTSPRRRPSDVDVPDLAAGPLALAVQVHLDVGQPARTGGAAARPCSSPPAPRGAPSTLAITATGAIGVGRRRADSPAPRAGAARTGLVRAPSMVQCPELCGRIASSLTTQSPSAVSNSSTASTPTTPSSSASRSASCLRRPPRSRRPAPARARSPRRRCRRAARSRTTGHAAPCPNGDRATSAASSRRIGTCSSTSTGCPSAR